MPTHDAVMTRYLRITGGQWKPCVSIAGATIIQPAASVSLL